MKKILSFALLLSSALMINAQSSLGVTYKNHTYNDGDTITVTMARDAEHCTDLGVFNQSNSRIEGIVISLEEVSRNGFEVWAMCTGDVCIQGLTSNPINLGPRERYNQLQLDIFVDASVQNALSVYTMTVGTPDIHSTVVLRFVFADEVGILPTDASEALVAAYPNPAIDNVNIRYSVDGSGELTLYDMQGRAVARQTVSGEGTATFSGLAAGVYTYTLATATGRSTLRKLVVR